MRRVLLLPSLALVVLFVVTFVLTAGPFRARTAAVRPIIIVTADDIKTLDAGKMSWASDIRVAMSLWEGLATYDIHDNLKPIPGAAASWEISPDGKTYVFHLRPEARWSNGDPVTADDFLFAWKRVLDPVTGSDYIGFFKDVKGAEEYTAALTAKKEPDGSALGLIKRDDLTLEVQLKAPCTYFLDLVAMPVFFPLHEASMRKFQSANPAEGYDARWTQPPNLVTNGAFKLKEWEVQRQLTLVPNEYYWDKENVKCPELQFRKIEDSRAALLSFETGQADLLTFRPPDFADEMLKQQREEHKWPELHSMPVFGTYYYLFNCTRPPFDDKRVRKALALAIDREQIVGILNTGERPLGVIVPPDSINGYKSPDGLKENVAEARKLLSEAGFPGGKGMKTIELLFNTESVHGKIAQAIGQMWQTNLGVEVSYRGMERGSFGTARRQDHDFDVARGGWYGDYPDPTTWLDLLRSGDGNNDGRFSSKAYDDLMARSDMEADPAKRFALLRQAEGMICEDELPFIPLYQYADGFMYDGKRLEGAEMNVRVLTELKWVRRK